MSVCELIKTALPEAAIQNDAASIITPTKASAAVATTTTTITTNSNSGTPQKLKNQQITTLSTNNSNNDKIENVAPVTTSQTSATNTTTSNSNAAKGKIFPKTSEEFIKDLQQFHERRSTPITHMPKISGRIVDLHGLYNEVTERGGFHKVNTRDEWDEVLPIVGLRDKCVNACAAVKQIYRRFLEKYERLTFFGEDPDKMEALEAADALESGRSRSSRYPSMHGGNSNINTVPMAYNYRQHIVNMDRRRTFHLSTDLHKHSGYEKLMLSLLSPLPNEQDFAINVCTLMANESKLTLKLLEYPKILDILLAHAGVFADFTLRQLFQQVYIGVRKHSLYTFWYDLLHDKQQLLELYTDEQAMREAALIPESEKTEQINNELFSKMLESLAMDFLNLGRGHGTQDFVGQRVLQIINILRNLSFFDENITILAKNRTFLRFLVMCSNIRWGNIHTQALDIAGNIALELVLLDPSLDDLSRSLMATLCDGIESADRAVIINSLEILYKLCQKDSNEDYINKCLNLKFYETLCLFLSLNDIMLLIFTLEAMYALTSMGTRSCHIIMQVRGIIDQLVSLITVEAQAYGPDGCILMRVVETVPGNMLPMVAQNIANLQNVSVVQQLHNTTTNNNNNNKIQQQTLTQTITSVAGTTALVQQQIPTTTSAAVSVILQQQTQILQQQQQFTNTADTTLQVQKTQPNVTPQINNNNNNSEQQQQLQQQQTASPQAPPATQATFLPTYANQQQQQQTAIATQTTSSSNNQIIALTTTTTTTPTAVVTTPTNQFTHDDDQYALAWLGATFERAAGIESRIEQQELYRMYLTHCQKSGKHSVVNHIQFPRLVRMIFGNNVGPAIVRRADGTEYNGIHYVAIKLRAIPLPIQIKTTTTSSATTTTPVSNIQQQQQQGVKMTADLKKIKKKPIQQQQHLGSSLDEKIIKTNEQQQQNSVKSTDVRPTLIISSNNSNNSITTTTTTSKAIITSNIQLSPAKHQLPQLQQQKQQYQLQISGQQQPSSSSSSLIKSLLANKVTQRQQKQKEQIIISQPTNANSNNSNQQQQQQTPIKVNSNAISALVNNPLMQNTPVKVGQTTIKPLNPQISQIEKKQQQQQQQQQHSLIMESSVPPPLAPLSGNNVVKDSSGRSMIIANQMLVEILDKKAGEPPIPATIIKRKLDDGDVVSGQTIKRLAYDGNGSVIGVVSTNNNSNNNNNNGNNGSNVTPSKNAANFYAEMAASILEDEDLDDIPTLLTHTGNNNNSNLQTVATIPITPSSTPTSQLQQLQQLQQQQQHQHQLHHHQQTMLSVAEQQQQQSILIPAKMPQNMQRQILFQTGGTASQPQLKLHTNTGQPTAMATIKTDQGLQTVPVILQQKSLDPNQPQLVLQVIDFLVFLHCNLKIKVNSLSDIG